MYVTGRVAAIVEADIMVLPDAAFHGVAMAFDQAGHQHFVGESFIQDVVPPAAQVLQLTGTENHAGTDRDMTCRRPPGIHGDDVSRPVDGDVAHGRRPLVLVDRTIVVGLASTRQCLV